MKPTVSGTYPFDQPPEPHGASSRALHACESTCVNLAGYIGPTRSASFPTEVNNALTWFVPSGYRKPLVATCGRSWGKSTLAYSIRFSYLTIAGKCQMLAA